MINCIKVTEAMKAMVIILTAGEDELIRIWDLKFVMINEIQIKKLEFYKHLPMFKISANAYSTNLSAQSLDVYFCQ